MKVVEPDLSLLRALGGDVLLLQNQKISENQFNNVKVRRDSIPKVIW